MRFSPEGKEGTKVAAERAGRGGGEARSLVPAPGAEVRLLMGKVGQMTLHCFSGSASPEESELRDLRQIISPKASGLPPVKGRGRAR